MMSPSSSATTSQPSAPPAPSSSSMMFQPRALLVPNSSSMVSQPSTPPAPVQSSPAISPSRTPSTAAPFLLHVTSEISPSMVYHGDLLIDTKVSVTYQETKNTRDPVHVIFIVDVSGSMQSAIPDVQRTLTDMIQTKLRAGDKVSIIKFDRAGHVVVNARTLPDDTLEGTIRTAIVVGEGTFILSGFQRLAELTKTDAETHIILATDGKDLNFEHHKIHSGATLIDYVERCIIPQVKQHVGDSVPVHSIGMTTEVDQGITGLLSTKTGTAQRFIRSANDIGQALDELASYICADDRTPAGRMTVTQDGKTLQTFDIPSLPSGNPFPRLVRLPVSQVDIKQPIEIQYDFPHTAPVIKQVSYNPSVVANIDAIAADIINRYEQLMAARPVDFKSELLRLLVEIITLKTNYQHASWTELHNAENKVRGYIAAIENNDIAQQMQYNIQTLMLQSTVTRPSTQQNNGAALPSSSQQSTTTPVPAKQSPMAALNHYNVAAHIAHATEKKWPEVLIALNTFAGQVISPEIKLLAAIDKADIAAIQSCFAEGVDPKGVDARGWSWVMVAMGLGADVTVINTLVERDVPLDVRSNASGADALAMARSHLSAMQAANFADKQVQVDRLANIVAYLQQQTAASTPASPLTQVSLFPATSSSTSSPAPVASVDVPEDMLCPVSLEIMADPVIISTGISVDKATLLQHLALKERQGLPATCPLSNTTLERMPGGTFYLSNVTLKNTIEQWQKQHQQPSTSMTPKG